MAVTEQTPIASSAANGVTTSFPHNFTVLSTGDLVVTGLAPGAAVPVTYTYGTHYTLTGVGTASGSVEFISAPANGTVITRYRNSAIRRDTDYQENGDFLAGTVDLDFDRVWLLLQEIFLGGKAPVGSLRVPAGETVGALASAADRALKTLTFDADGNPVATTPAAGTADALAAALIDPNAPNGARLIQTKLALAGAVAMSQHDFNSQFVTGKGLGFTNDGVTDNSAAFVRAANCGKAVLLDGGVYHCTDYAVPTSGVFICLIGKHKDLVTVTCASSRIPIYCNAAVGVDARIAGAFIKGIKFKGGHVRDRAFAPYNSDPGASATQALNLRGVKGVDSRGWVTITECGFEDFNGLPVWVADFGRVEFSKNHLYRTKDPGFLYNESVHVFGNVVEFAADNGVSVSRANQYIHVHDNKMIDCASAGIFVGGVQLTGSGATLTLTGASYVLGATLTMTASASTFTTEDKGINFLLQSGSDVVVVRTTVITSATVATVVALGAVPASLQAIATADWDRGPVSGAQSGSIHDNTIEGGKTYGINLSQGCKDLNVHSNAIRRTGIIRDSETYTTGTILASNNTLTVDDATNFAALDWICIVPDYTHENYFIAKINSIAGNVLTLNANAPQTLVRERVHKAIRQTAAYGIVATGNYDTSTILEFAENLNIHDNIIVDSVTGGARLGSTSGAIRNSRVHDNIIYLRQTVHVEATTYGVLVGDQGTTAMRTVGLEIDHNQISLEATGGIGISYKPVDSNSASYIAIGPNKIRQVLTDVSVIEQTGSTDITTTYAPSTRDGALAVPDLITTKNLGAEAGSATFNAGALTLTQIVNSITPSANIVVTDIVKDTSVLHDTPLMCVRNAHATRTITLTYNSAKIRVDGAVDYVIQGYGMVWLQQLSAGLWQVIGKP